jgi:SAM-dependent methyltransferase
MLRITPGIDSKKEVLSNLMLAPARAVIRRNRTKEFKQLRAFFENKHGLEIGGPSSVFEDKSLLPIYGLVGSCDNCTFSNTTIWHDRVKEGLTYKYHPKKPMGYQYICEGSSLASIDNERYDFVMCSHVIEHKANPLKAILEWKRVVRTGGILLIVSPHKEKTFDHRRPITTLTHLKDDYDNSVGEQDLSHLPEILKFHDLRLDPKAGSFVEFQARSEQNAENRCLHHHVFITESWIYLLDYLNLDIVYLGAFSPIHIIAVGMKVTENAENLGRIHASNKALIESNAHWRRKSPFKLDKVSQRGQCFQ